MKVGVLVNITVGVLVNVTNKDDLNIGVLVKVENKDVWVSIASIL